MRVLAVLVIVLAQVDCPVLAEDEARLESDDSFAYVRNDAEKIKVYMQSDRKEEVPLQPGPLYTSEEVIRDWDKGTSWVWGAKGRPAVFLTMTTAGDSRHYEFISLATQRLDVDTGYRTRWMPEPGWKPIAIKDAPGPAAERRRRMIQMRSLARRFTAHTIDQNESGKRYDLDLLPQPIYRYVEESDASLDGGIFAFCRDSNIEVILVIDASKMNGEGTRWMFDCQRCKVHELHVQLDGEEAWNREGIPFSAATPQSAYHIFSRIAREEEKLVR